MSSIEQIVDLPTGRARTFYLGLRNLGYRSFAGVPCSMFGALYAILDEYAANYYPATREDLALGLACGLTLGGQRCAVLMQNSGLGTCVNALQSLVDLYRVPLLLVVSWRGETTDAPEHLEVGRIRRARR
jgi:sulfopyruvate decarboxylase subunit alpha